MPAIPNSPLDRKQTMQLANALRERIVRPIAVDVWTQQTPVAASDEQEPGPHTETTLQLMRQIKSLHPGINLTPYDLDQHASMAAERGITESPTVVLRCGGRSITTVGLFFGTLFPPFLDQMGFLSLGRTPLSPETRALLQGLSDDLTIEAFLTPYDGASAQMMPLLGALAAEGRRVRLTEIEATQFPALAGRREVTEVPLLFINGRRLAGFFDEAALTEQIERILAGSEEPATREAARTAPYLSEAEIRRRLAGRELGPEAAAGELSVPEPPGP